MNMKVRRLIEAAEMMLLAVDEQHRSNPEPLKYTVPWGRLNELREAAAAFSASEKLRIAGFHIRPSGKTAGGLMREERDDAKAMWDTQTWGAKLQRLIREHWESSSAARERTFAAVIEHVNWLRNDAALGWKARQFAARHAAAPEPPAPSVNSPSTNGATARTDSEGT